MKLYISDKPNWETFVHVNIVIDNAHHIIEINNANVSFNFDFEKFKKSVKNGNIFKEFIFCFDDEGYHNGKSEEKEDIFKNGSKNYSHLSIAVKNRNVIITSFYKNSVIKTYLPITNTNTDEICKKINDISNILFEGFNKWYGRCIEDMFFEQS